MAGSVFADIATKYYIHPSLLMGGPCDRGSIGPGVAYRFLAGFLPVLPVSHRFSLGRWGWHGPSVYTHGSLRPRPAARNTFTKGYSRREGWDGAAPREEGTTSAKGHRADQAGGRGTCLPCTHCATLHFICYSYTCRKRLQCSADISFLASQGPLLFVEQP